MANGALSHARWQIYRPPNIGGYRALPHRAVEAWSKIGLGAAERRQMAAKVRSILSNRRLGKEINEFLRNVRHTKK